jgi:hypothetical protein
MRRSGCKVVIEQDCNPCKALFSGNRLQIDAAKAMVSAVIANGPSILQVSFLNGPQADNGSMITQEIPLIQSQVGQVIGPGGSIVKELQSRCSVRVKINQPSGPNGKGPMDHVLRITGFKQCSHYFYNFFFHFFFV